MCEYCVDLITTKKVWEIFLREISLLWSDVTEIDGTQPYYWGTSYGLILLVAETVGCIFLNCIKKDLLFRTPYYCQCHNSLHYSKRASLPSVSLPFAVRDANTGSHCLRQICNIKREGRKMSGKGKWYWMKILREKSNWSFEFLDLLHNEKEKGRKFPFRMCWRKGKGNYSYTKIKENEDKFN